jgi:glycosyltransferase involved in cell wall biosynthesis
VAPEQPAATRGTPNYAPSLLFISSDRFKPFRVDVSILFAQELVSRGYRIDWILQSDEACDWEYVVQWGGGDAWVGKTDLGTSRFSRLRKHLYGIANEFRMFRLLRTRRYDCVVFKDKFIAPLLGLVAARINKVPLFYWLSYPFPEESLLLAREGRARYPMLYFVRGQLFRYLLYRVILPRAHHVFVQTEQMKQDVMAMGIPAAKMTPVVMGVDLSRIPYKGHVATPPALASRRPTLLYLGTLIKVRKLDFLIRVLAKVKHEIPNVRLLMVGDGDDPSDRAMLEAEAARCKVTDEIEFTGFLPKESAWQIVAEADVCVSPIYPTPILNAGSPTKLIEYMAMGKAVIANDHPEQRQVINESGAGLCVRWDESEFAAATVRLLRDPELATEMGIRGRRYIESKRDYRSIARMVDGTFRTNLKAFSAGEAATRHS